MSKSNFDCIRFGVTIVEVPCIAYSRLFLVGLIIDESLRI